jgi:phosphohistidine phosphatase
MQVYLLRHGIAHDKSAKGGDAARELTAEGRAELKHVLKTAAKAGVKPSLILTSPYVRARETAALAKKILETREDLLETKTLVPEGQPQMVWAEMSDHRAEPSLMLVGHNPLLEQMVAHLLGTPTLQFQFEKAALVALEISNFRGEPDGVLQWILTPALA